MTKISIKTAYNDINEFAATGKSYPADGAVFLVKQLKPLLVGHKLDKILNTWLADYRFPAQPDQTLQQSVINDIEWEGPFVFVINGQHVFMDFGAPGRYQIGINSENIAEIATVTSMNISELEQYGHNGKFVDISSLYGNDIIGQNVQDLHTIVDDRHNRLSAVIIELKNGVSLVVSEETDDPMLRVYQNIQQAKKAIAEQQKDTFKFD